MSLEIFTVLRRQGDVGEEALAVQPRQLLLERGSRNVFVAQDDFLGHRDFHLFSLETKIYRNTQIEPLPENNEAAIFFAARL